MRLTGLLKKNSSGVSSGILNNRGEVHPLLKGCAEDVLEFYQKHSDCFSIASTSDIPANLNWQEGTEEKEFSSPDAQKGGTWEVFMRDFPRTLRTIGPDANGAFRSYLLDYNVMSLTTHILTRMDIIQGLRIPGRLMKTGERCTLS